MAFQALLICLSFMNDQALAIFGEGIAQAEDLLTGIHREISYDDGVRIVSQWIQ
jgi:hypothetical protein